MEIKRLDYICENETLMKQLILLFAFLVASSVSSAQSKIGTIDADFILAQMPEMAEVNKGLEAYGKELQADLDSTLVNYDSLIKSFQEKVDSYSEEEKATKGNEIMALENDIKGYRQKASVMIQMRRNELTQPLYEKINTAMLSVVQEEGFTQILHAGSNALAFSAEGYDITLKVLNKLGISVSTETE